MLLTDLLVKFNACDPAKEWAATLGAKQQADQAAWDACPRADWLLRILGDIGATRQTLVLAACACAREALPFVAKGEKRPAAAIELAVNWASGGRKGRSLDVVGAAAIAADLGSASEFPAAYAAHAATITVIVQHPWVSSPFAAYWAARAMGGEDPSAALLRLAAIVCEAVEWRDVAALLKNHAT